MKLLRTETGICICEDCSKYSESGKCCSDGRTKPDSPTDCKNFKCAYHVCGANDAKWHN